MANTTLLEKVSIVNNAVRTLLAVVLLGGLGYGSWYGYNIYNATEIKATQTAQELATTLEQLSAAQGELESKDAVIAVKQVKIGELNVQVEDQQAEIQRIDLANRLLKVDQRIAILTVLGQKQGEDGKVLESEVEFQELNDNGDPLDEPRRFTIMGDIIYIDSWVVKFEDKYIEQADFLRGTSLVLFRRIFSEQQSPRDGFVLDPEGARPAVYASGSELSEFEQKIWSDFWTVADDKQKQAELGIRTMHAEAPSRPVKEGMRYRVTRRASGGLTFEPDREAPQRPKPAA